MTVLAQEQEGGGNFLLPNLTIVIEVLAFLLILYVLRRWVWPPLSKAMNDRQAMVRRQAAESTEATRRLRQAEERFDSALAEARREAATIRDEARADAKRIREEMRVAADAEVERIRQRGEEQLARQREQVTRQLRAELGGLAVQLAERIIGQSLADDGLRRATVDRFLADLDQVPGEPRKAGAAGGAS
ncbi:F0F1 ATP synthase subunit B [Pseudonocardia asaccharolytica]|uniref:ATP synthase subunit b n=1 Tax=Pseudonocardia asaccharolytica DSM 44247 = NBRC 16224 TaxID=1123024 RepID=A0A511D3R0_9PSEU|nr:F0F1 ATP synthase subunit B [Pseudonocardia asaccharolytica]GEL17548.1 ATP synthase subunit b [Pseudonocardia asaccharolytica DSM 44247 = NBRC 16224]